jgi:hypothetical protein
MTKPARKKKPTTDPTTDPTPEASAQIMWVVMTAYLWSNVTVNGMPMRSPADGPQRFMPVFESREQAVAWNNGCEDNVSIVRVT